MPIFGMDQWLVDRLARMLRWFEARPADSDTERPQVPNWQAVRITGEKLGSDSGSGESGSGCSGSGLGCIDERDFYPGIVVAWSAPDCEEVEYGDQMVPVEPPATGIRMQPTGRWLPRCNLVMPS